MQSIGAVILAAGGSSRLGQAKQLLRYHGKSLVRRMVDLAREAGCDPVVVVLGSDQGIIAAELRESGATTVENESWREGIGTSVRAGVQRVAQDRHVAAVVLLVCDQPFVDASVVRDLMALHQSKPIVACRYDETFGVPALFDRSYFADLLALDDSSGAKSVILKSLDRVAAVPFSAGKIDIDTPEDARSLGLLPSEKLAEAVENLPR